MGGKGRKQADGNGYSCRRERVCPRERQWASCAEKQRDTLGGGAPKKREP